MPTVQCGQCGTSFSRVPAKLRPNKAGMHFCSRECSAQHKRAQIEVPCANCGALLLRPPHRFDKSERQFCNVACAGAWSSRNIRGDDHPLRNRLMVPCSVCGKLAPRTPSKKGPQTFCSQDCYHRWRRAEWTAPTPNPPIQVTCAACGTEFRKQAAKAMAGARHFCGVACAIQWRAKHCRGNTAPNWKGAKREVECSYCKKNILRPKQGYRPKVGYFCSRECRCAWLSENRSGEASPYWRGGRQFYGRNWKRQRRAARERDGHQCQHCGRTRDEEGTELPVHHIKAFRNFGYIPGENENYRQANALSNLITLCRVCHAKAEHGTIAVQPKLL